MKSTMKSINGDNLQKAVDYLVNEKSMRKSNNFVNNPIDIKIKMLLDKKNVVTIVFILILFQMPL